MRTNAAVPSDCSDRPIFASRWGLGREGNHRDGRDAVCGLEGARQAELLCFLVAHLGRRKGKGDEIPLLVA